MTLMSRYVGRRWTLGFFSALGVLAAAFMAGDAAFRVWALAEKGLTVGEIVLTFVLKLPSVFTQVAPLAALLATLLTVTALKRSRELGAFFSGGAGLLRLYAPVLGATLLVSLASLAVSEKMAPRANRMGRSLELKGHTTPGRLFSGTDRIWLLEGNSVIYISNVEDQGRLLVSPTILTFSGPGLEELATRVDGPEARWDGTEWEMPGAIIRRFQDGRLAEEAPPTRVLPSVGVTPAEFFKVRRTPDEMGRREMEDYIDSLVRAGVDATRYRVRAYRNGAAAAIPLVLGLLALPVGLLVPVRGGVPLGTGLAVLFTLAYWSLFSFSLSLGNSGVVPPAAAAWSVNALFLAGGFVSLLLVRRPRLT